VTLDSALVEGLVQPDQTSCGPSALVAARMLLDPVFRASVQRFGWGPEVLDTHRRLTGFIDAAGALQVPWPSALGSPPWAVAREISTYDGPSLRAVPYSTHVVTGSNRLDLFGRIVAGVTAGRPVPFFVGSSWLPRHVVLAVGPAPGGLSVYNPADGRVVTVSSASFTGARLSLAGWSKPWFVVLPDRLT
jgi:hypothetical protein